MYYIISSTFKLNLLQRLMYLCSLGGTSKFVLMLLLLSFESYVSHQWIAFAKVLQLIVVIFHYNSVIIVNHIEIFVFVDYKPLLKVTFLYVSKKT